jgi:hypothetical protein
VKAGAYSRAVQEAESGGETAPEAEREPRASRAVLRRRAAIVVALVLFVGLTNYWAHWQQAIAHVGAVDVLTYEQVAEAAPSFPSHRIGSAYSERFAIHYATGLASYVSGVGLHAAYRVVSTLFLVLTLLALHALVSKRRLSTFAYGLILAIFILNPYALRSYVITPGDFQVVFVLGLAVLMLGLTSRRLPLVLLGLSVAALGRQTTLLVGPAAVIWVLGGAGWRTRSLAHRIWSAASMLGLTFGIYLMTIAVTASFTHRFQPEFPHDTILHLIGSLPTGASKLAGHALRVTVPLVMPVSALLAGLFVRDKWRGRLPSLPLEFWASLLIAAAIVVQPLLISPDFPGLAHNEQRLSVLGLVPLVVALTFLLEHLERVRQPDVSWPRTALLFGVLGIASFHHQFTVVGPNSLGQFAVLQLATAVLVALLLGSHYRTGRLAQKPAAA